MEKNRQGWLVSETQRQCTNCFELYTRTSKTVTLCPTCNSGRVKTQNLQTKIYRRAKRRALERGLEFALTPEDITVPHTCPILGIPLYVTTGRSGAFPNSPSLDRIDSTLGYTKDNVWVISQLANSMKSNASVGTLKAFGKWIETL